MCFKWATPFRKDFVTYFLKHILNYVSLHGFIWNQSRQSLLPSCSISFKIIAGNRFERKAMAFNYVNICYVGTCIHCHEINID